MDKDKFLDSRMKSMGVLGFWDDEYKSSIIRCLESSYNPEIISQWGISDMVINGDKVLLKWYKRHTPLSKDELELEYGIKK